MKTVTCKTCGKRSQTDQPCGWYSLSVHVPPHINPRHYIWIGTFCQPKCLALYMPEVRLMDEYTAGIYERDGRPPEDVPQSVRMDEDVPQSLR